VGYYNSFVVRIWSDEQGPARGSIEHVWSHESLVFADPAAVVDFIRVHLTPPPSAIPHSEEEEERQEDDAEF
jgi:hypothetical protein